MFSLLPLLLLLLSATLTLSLPLNINLGAYSPALVVGDGEISFAGKQDVATLMNALEGAAVSAAANNAVGNTGGGQTNAANAVIPNVGTVSTPPEAAAAAVSPAQPAPVDPNAAAIARMQSGVGMGNDLEPRTPVAAPAPASDDSAPVKTKEKRDLAGFDRALNYATAALKTSPGLELGTGEGGSGVGIKQLPGGQAAVAKAGKRDVHGSGERMRRRNRITTLLVRGVDFSGGKDKREIANVQARNVPIEARSDDNGVNLNVSEGHGLLMRVVEEGVEDED